MVLILIERELFSKATIGIPLFISKEKGFGFSKLLWNKTTHLSGRIILSGKTMEKKKEAKNKRKTTKKNFFCSCNEIAEEKLYFKECIDFCSTEADNKSEPPFSAIAFNPITLIS